MLSQDPLKKIFCNFCIILRILVSYLTFCLYVYDYVYDYVFIGINCIFIWFIQYWMTMFFSEQLTNHVFVLLQYLELRFNRHVRAVASILFLLDEVSCFMQYGIILCCEIFLLPKRVGGFITKIMTNK